jgi:hypothetical protein
MVYGLSSAEISEADILHTQAQNIRRFMVLFLKLQVIGHIIILKTAFFTDSSRQIT